jgi:hypothetical protein
MKCGGERTRKNSLGKQDKELIEWLRKKKP